jgi:hypothetical protein
MGLKSVAILRPGDRFAYRYLDEDLTVEVLRASEMATDYFGRPVVRFWAKRLDTQEEGFMSYGPGIEIDVIEPPANA